MGQESGIPEQVRHDQFHRRRERAQAGLHRRQAVCKRQGAGARERSHGCDRPVHSRPTRRVHLPGRGWQQCLRARPLLARRDPAYRARVPVGQEGDARPDRRARRPGLDRGAVRGALGGIHRGREQRPGRRQVLPALGDARVPLLHGLLGAPRRRRARRRGPLLRLGRAQLRRRGQPRTQPGRRRVHGAAHLLGRQLLGMAQGEDLPQHLVRIDARHRLRIPRQLRALLRHVGAGRDLLQHRQQDRLGTAGQHQRRGKGSRGT